MPEHAMNMFEEIASSLTYITYFFEHVCSMPGNKFLICLLHVQNGVLASVWGLVWLGL